MTSPTTVQVRLQIRADTAANWTSTNPILLANELGRETDTGKFKIGDGTTAWSSLSYQGWSSSPLAVSAGGTGQTSYTDGQLLIGNSTGNTLTKATLTAGSGISVTNGGGSITLAVSGITNSQIDANAEIAVSKLADGTPRQLLQTDAAGTGVEWASNIDVPGTLDVTGAATFDSSVAVTGALTKSGNNVVTVGDTGTVTSSMIADGTIVDADINASAEIAVSKLADGSARQLLQTDSAGTGVEWTSNVDIPGTLDITGRATFDGIASHPLGTAAAPTVTFTGDTNTGIYSPGADQVAISTNGTGRLFVDASGNVGVGTSPVVSFHIANASPVIRLEDTDGTNLLGQITQTSGISVYTSRNDATAGSFYFQGVTGSTTTNYLRMEPTVTRFYASGNEAARIDSSGRLGLGTSTPGTVGGGATLNIEQAGGARLVMNSLSRRFYVTGASGADDLRIGRRISTDTVDNDIVTITGGGNVGIGTTSPTFPLTVDTGAAGNPLTGFGQDSQNPYLHLERWNGVSNYDAVRISAFPGSAAGGVLVFSNGTGTTKGAQTFTERARIDSSGRLLVGTSSARSNYYGSIAPNGIQNESGFKTLFYNANSAVGSAIFMGKSRGTAALSNTIVQADDDLGVIVFFGADGTNAIPAAQILAEVDGTPGANDMPGRLVFSTTADGASSPTERMRIAANGVVTIQNGAVAVIGTLTDAATITPDLAADCNFTVTLGGNRTIANPTNITAGQSGSIFIVQDATGGRTASWGSYWDFPGGTAPTLSTAANAVDRVDYIVRSSTSIHTVFTANYS